jgi:hypothetical protein
MQALNEQFLPGNTCFGCGLDNPEGMRIRIYRDGDSDTALTGTFDPRVTMGGFPQVVHGGLQFTAQRSVQSFVPSSPTENVPTHFFLERSRTLSQCSLSPSTLRNTATLLVAGSFTNSSVPRST